MQRQLTRIGPQLRASRDIEIVTNPFSGSSVGEVAVANATDVEDAIACSVEGYQVMRRLPTHRRIAILEETARGIEARAEELARLITAESGKPIRFSRGEVTRAALTFSIAAGEARGAQGEVLPVDLEARAEGRLCLHRRVPRGPVAAIAPFNFPLNLIAHKLAPAVAVGTSAVVKVPPQCPLTGHVLGEILSAAGLPGEALSVLHCAPELAQRMVEDPRMKVLSFTGSDVVGWKLKGLAGAKQVLLELGGNAPCVIDAGVDLDQVLPAVVAGAWAYAGQVCIKVQRVLCHESLYDEFLARFVEATEALPCGDPMDEATVVGPLIEDVHVERVQAWIAEAVAAGAKLLTGGGAEDRVVRPAILTEVPPEARISKDEVFGPVTIVERFEHFGECLERCNRSRFGLQAGLFTRDLGHALRAFEELDYGGVIINDVPTFRVDSTPYGGTKDSGLGREGVRFAMDELCETKLLVMRGL